MSGRAKGCVPTPPPTADAGQLRGQDLVLKVGRVPRLNASRGEAIEACYGNLTAAQNQR